MRLTVIGSGDAFGSGGRFNTCFRIEAAQTILLDCGASSLVAMKAQGIDANTVDGIILSHLHGDHFGAIPFLLLDSQFLNRRDKPLVIAGPPGTRERITAALDVLFPGSSAIKWRFPLDIIDVALERPHEILGFSVVTTEVIHQSGAPSTAVRLSDGSKVLAYSGDTEWTEALVAVADGADLFIIECYDYERSITGHMSFVKLKERRGDLRARRIMITHMNPTMLAKVEEARSLGLLVAEDGLRLDV